jgi:hypothetical protein
MGMISLMYTQLMGPKEREKMTDTAKQSAQIAQKLRSHSQTALTKEQEKHSSNGVASARAVWVRSVESSFREQSKCDGECSNQERLLTAHTIEDEEDEDEVGDWSHAIVDSRDQNSAVAFDSQCVVHGGLVVSDDVWESGQSCDIGKCQRLSDTY